MSDHPRGSGAPLWLTLLATVGALCLIVLSLFIFGGVWAVKSVVSSLSQPNVHVYKHKAIHTSGDAAAYISLEGQVTAELAQKIMDKLDSADKEKRFVGVLLEVNSPGGSVVASQEIYDRVARLKASKPVVVYMREVAASGAYYASATASKIVANRGTMVGSIGVILQSFETSQLLKWLKLSPVTLKTGSLKDAGSPLREWTVEERRYLQNLIDTTRKQFVDDVAQARSLPPSSLDTMSDGRVVLGPEALELKLVDALGSRADALKALGELAGKEAELDLEEIPDKVEIHDLLGRAFRLGAQNLLPESLSLDPQSSLPQIQAR